MNRRAMWTGATLVLAVCVVAAVVITVRATSQGTSSDNARYYGPLTARQYGFALTIAERDYGKEGNRVVVATAKTYPGMVSGGNLSGTCRSGQVLEVDLAGSFPGTEVLSDTHDTGQKPGEEVIYKADATTGQPCLVSFSEGGTYTRDTKAADLLPALQAQ